MKICSFLPSGTEIACWLGLEKNLVGVTHECDYPFPVRGLPKVVGSRYDSHKLAPAEVDRLVSEALRRGESLYQIDENLLAELAPDLILTQDLCQVCAPSGSDAVRAIKRLPNGVQVLYLTPKSLDEIFENVTEVGEATGTSGLARAKAGAARKEIARIADAAGNLERKSAFFLEWIDPPYCSGHWLPEMVIAAGGADPLGLTGRDSMRVSWQDISRVDPEAIVVSPCGYHLEDAVRSAEKLLGGRNDLKDLKAYRNGGIYVVDADAYFVRPGPRVVEGVRILAEIFHPETFSGIAPPNSYRKIFQ